MVIEEVTKELHNGEMVVLPTQKKKKSVNFTDYDEYGVDMEKVNRYGSVYILTKGCTVTDKLLVEGDGTIEIVYGPQVSFMISQDFLRYIPNKVEIDVQEGDRIIPLQTFKQYPGTKRYQTDRDSFVVYFVEK